MLSPKTKFALIISLILIVLGVLFIIESQKTGKLRLIFCDVGQGDGILIVSPNGKQVVVDGGPGTKIVDCLGKKMPFWDRTIEMMILTHAQKDHMEGQIELFDSYKVEKVIWTGVENETVIFDQWQESLKTEEAKVYLAKAGDTIIMGRISFDILWPTKTQISDWEKLPPQDLNDTSVVIRIEYENFCAYFTGDIPKEIFEELINKKCQILKVSHHGSKTGTSKEIVDKVDPQVVVIQVGRNRFGHPNQDVLDLFEKTNVIRNDISAIVEIETDGNSYIVN